MAKGAATWKRVKFGEVVRRNTETCKDPASVGIERVIGLEHLEPGDLRVRSWGAVTDGTTFTNRVRPGQVLFGKRRAYQRKLAVADFDAICSGDIYVLESANPSKLLPDLLPFICRTDSFFEHAVGTSAGSLSPRTNWTSLAEYEFALPPPQEQVRISALLSGATGVCRSHVDAADAARQLFRGMLEDLLAHGTERHASKLVGGARYAETWPTAPLGSIAKVERGKFSHRPRNLPQFFGGTYPFIQVGDIAASIGPLGPPTEFLTEEGVQYSRSFPAGTVLISITGAVLAKTAITTQEIWTTDSIVGIRPNKSALPEFLEFVLRRLHPLLNGSLATKSTTQKNINLETLRPLLVPCPDIGIQREVVSHLLEAQATASRHQARAQQASRLLETLTVRAFEGAQ
jgi:type I restriction enzyme, S subunit